jgi:hypothetical protein
MKILLSELNQFIAEQRGVPVDNLAISTKDDKKVEVKEIASAKDISPKAGEDVTKTVAERQETAEEIAAMTPDQQAAKLRSEADRLYKQAAVLRKEAEELSPTKKKEK